MTVGSRELNPGVGGGKILVDTQTSPTGSEAQVVKVAFGPASSATMVDDVDGQRLPVKAAGNALSTGGYWPSTSGVRFPYTANSSRADLLCDVAGNLMIRGPVTTDETSVREDFPGSSIGASVGTVAFTNGSTAITGTGFLASLRHYDYIKRDSDGDSAWAQIQEIVSDTAATLVSGYTGTTGSSASTAASHASVANGTAFTVASSSLTLNMGTAAGSAYIFRNVDFGPLAVNFANTTISQRIANQDVVLGFQNAPTSPRTFARFRFTGTTNTAVICESAYVRSGTPGANDTEQVAITMPSGITSATAARYRVEVLPNKCRFYINDIAVAETSTHMPDAYDLLGVMVGGVNAATVAAGSIAIDGFGVQNFDRLVVGAESNYDRTVFINPDKSAAISIAANSTASGSITDLNGYALATVQLTGTFTATAQIQITNDGTNWVNVTGSNSVINAATGAYMASGNLTATGIYQVDIAGVMGVRVITTAYTSGTITGTVRSTAATGQVSIDGTPTVVVGSGTVTTVTTCSTLTTLANGQTAHSSASTGSPVRVGGRVITTLDTTLAQGDASDLAVSTGQQLLVKQFATSENDWQFVGTVTTTTQTAIKAAGAASIRNFVTGITYQNTNATATTLLIQDGNTTILSISCAASMANPVNLVFPTPLRGTAATAINYTAGTTGANVLLNVQGYQSF